MFNTTKSVVFLKHDKELYDAIIECITIARNLSASAYGKSVLTADEGGSKRYPAATIFRLFEGYKSASNRKIFNEDWVLNCLNLALKGVRSKDSVHVLCTKQGKARKLYNQLSGYFKSNVLLLLHLLWVKKAVLLPVSTRFPKATGVVAQELLGRKDLVPELLGIFFDKDERYRLEDVVGSKGLKNAFANGYRAIRASDWYEVMDISEEDIPIAAQYTYAEKGYPFTLRLWLVGLSLVCPTIPYDVAKVPTGKMGLDQVRAPQDGDAGIATEFGFDEVTNEKLREWVDYIHRFGEARKRSGLKSWKEFIKINSVIVGWMINVLAPVSPTIIPSISEFKRTHLDGFDGVQGLLDYVKGDTSPSSYKATLYKIESFFEYLESFDDFNFRNKINRGIDYPFVPRNNSTSKVIFDNDVFAPLLSFTYALADWSWYLYEKSKDGGLQGFYHNHMKVVNTESAGFVPIFWVDGKPHPILWVTPKLAPIAFRKFKGMEHSSSVPNIHGVNLLVVIFETGIRLISARWLDVRNYRKSVNNRFYKPRDYGVNKIFINGDKVGKVWESTVANTVVEVLDRQAEYRASFDEESLEIESWYDGHENSPFGKVLPLFSVGGLPQGLLPTHKAMSDGTVRSVHKLFMYIFNSYFHLATGKQLMDVAYDIKDSSFDPSTSQGFINILNAYDSKLIDVTPHSARSQVVSRYITLLPPSKIMEITGHNTEAHIVYYAQLDKMVLEKAKSKQFEEVMRDIGEPASVVAQDRNSALRESFIKNREGALQDFAATSFTTNNHHKEFDAVDAVELVRTKDAGEIAFNTTHICPFNNVCPDIVLRELRSSQNSKPCGGCFYSVKTIDHIPAILAKIRAYTDESDELQKYLKEAKEKGVDASSLSSHAGRRRFLTDEVIAWTVTFQCLEQMAQDLSQKDTWLVKKPELLSQELERLEIKDDDFQSLYVKATEATSYAEFFTPTLKHQIVKARAKLLAYTGDFKALLDDAPDNYELIDQYRGMVQSICSHLNISLPELAKGLEEPLMLPNELKKPLMLLSDVKEKV